MKIDEIKLKETTAGATGSGSIAVSIGSVGGGGMISRDDKKKKGKKKKNPFGIEMPKDALFAGKVDEGTKPKYKNKQVRGKSPMPKLTKPTAGHESPHPFRGKLVGEDSVNKTSLPPHLSKFFDPDGNLKPEVSKRMSKNRDHEIKDVTPKGYGPGNHYEIGGDRYDGGIVFKVYIGGDEIHSDIIDGDHPYEYNGKKYDGVKKALDAIAKDNGLDNADDFERVEMESHNGHTPGPTLADLSQQFLDLWQENHRPDDWKDELVDFVKDKVENKDEWNYVANMINSFIKQRKAHFDKRRSGGNASSLMGLTYKAEGSIRNDMRAGIKWAKDADWAALHNMDIRMIKDYIKHKEEAEDISWRLPEANDFDMDAEIASYGDDSNDDEPMSDAPYAIVWHGQYAEWYGDGDPKSGNGRYKMKGDAGNVLAKNIPTYAQAEKLLPRIEKMGHVGDRGKWGEDHGVIMQSSDPMIIPMRELGEHFYGYDKDMQAHGATPKDDDHHDVIDLGDAGVDERKLSGSEKKNKEHNVKKLKKHKDSFSKYGKDAKSVMYAVATRDAKKGKKYK